MKASIAALGILCLAAAGGTIIYGSRLVKHMRTRYKANDDRAKPILSTFSNFGGQISAVVAAVLSGYGSH
jgi:fructose-specific phosphotransferase system IIC component